MLPFVCVQNVNIILLSEASIIYQFGIHTYICNTFAVVVYSFIKFLHSAYLHGDCFVSLLRSNQQRRPCNAQNITIWSDNNWFTAKKLKLGVLKRRLAGTFSESVVVLSGLNSATVFCLKNDHFVGMHGCHVYVQVKAPAINYLVDHTSLQILPEDTDWRTEANHRINQIRKSNIHIKQVKTDQTIKTISK